MSVKNASGTLASAVADAGTFTVSYPTNTDAGTFQSGVDHLLMINSNKMTYPKKFHLTFGTSNITVTNKSGASWPAGASYVLSLEKPGSKDFYDNRRRFQFNNNRVERGTDASLMFINLGAPDTADADGYCASQDLTSAGVFSVNTTAAAAIAAAALAGTADVPRNVVAAWTGAAVLTITGTDEYGNTLVESSASGTSLNGKKAFKTVTGISSSANITSLTVGTGNKLGLPVFLPSEAHVVSVAKDGVLRQRRTFPEFYINQTKLLAGTSVWTVAEQGGHIIRGTTVVDTAVTTGGTITVELGGTAVTGLGIVVANSSAVGDIDTDTPTTVDGSVAANIVADRAAIEIVGDAAFDTAGELAGNIEIASWGIFANGDQTSGGSTATTGDIRGTFVPPAAPDGSTVYQVVIAAPDAGYAGMAQHTA